MALKGYYIGSVGKPWSKFPHPFRRINSIPFKRMADLLPLAKPYKSYYCYSAEPVAESYVTFYAFLDLIRAL